MTATQIHGKIQFVDTNGVPLSGGKVYTYEPGTTTDKASYTVPAATVGTENTQPVVLDSRGEADIYVIGDCKIKVTDSLDNLIYTLDNVEDLKYVVTTSYIPYTGATTNINLGSKTLTTTGAVSTGAVSGTTGAFSGAVSGSGGTFTSGGAGSALSVTSSGGSTTIRVIDTGSAGANIRFEGNGGTTPNKYIRCYSGNLEFVNSAYSTVIATLTDAGTFSCTTLSSTLGTFSSGTTSSAINATSSGSASTIVVTDTGANGVGIKFVGDGGTTPNKFIRVKSGNLEFVNSAYGAVIATLTDAGSFSIATTLKSGGYTVATLPAAGTAGRRAYVTDATAPTFLGALVGGGAVVCPVFDNGSAWVSG